MSHQRLQATIEQAFEDRATITSQTKGEIREAVVGGSSLLPAAALAPEIRARAAAGKKGKAAH